MPLFIKRVLLIVSLLVVGLFMLSACSSIAEKTAPTEEPIPFEEIPPVVNATGVVVPAEWSILSMSTSGIVEEVFVEEGDHVDAGQTLIRLKGKEELQAAISEAEYEVVVAQKALDDLYENTRTKLNEILENIARTTDQVRDAQYQLDNYSVPYYQANLEPMEALDAMKEKLDQARETFEPYKYKSESDSTREDLKEELDDAQADYDSAVRRVEYTNTLEVAKDNLEKARQDYETWKNGPDPKELVVAEARLKNAQSALTAANAALEDLELKADFSGTVTELNVRVGEWVDPGIPILQLADLDHLRVETTDLNEIDAARVDTGAKVNITFDALPGVAVEGIVKSIAPKSSQGSGVNYKAVIELNEIPPELRWGMTAFVDIAVE